MEDYVKEAGAALRAIRRRRKLTLEEVAPRFSMSISALSRRERGIERLQRTDVDKAIDVYKLDLWEAHELRRAAGFLPTVESTQVDEASWRSQIGLILGCMPYPAWVVNSGGYVLAWNTGMALLWSLPQQSDHGPLHLFDIVVFSARSKELLEYAWRSTVLSQFSYYYHSTLAISGDPTFQATLQDQRRRYGKQFDEFWAAAQEEDALLGEQITDMAQLVGLYRTEAGLLRLLYLKSAAPYTDQRNLYVYLPIDNDSRQTYAQLCGDAKPAAFFA